MDKEKVKFFLRFAKNWVYAWIRSNPSQVALHLAYAELGKVHKAIGRELKAK